jgi:hypothetical protein
MICTRFTPDTTLARIRIQQWAAERTALRCGRVKQYTAPGRVPKDAPTNRFDAALVRCIDFEREFGKLDTDTQTILLLAFREKQTQSTIAQITNVSPRALSYKIPAALAQLARLLDRANLL